MGLASQNILKQNRLSITDSRVKILDLFHKSKGALAHADIEKKSGTEFDRVTIYRTLQTFVEKGIIHTIPTTDNSIKYALCKEACAEGHHHDDHIHFLCDKCGNTYCLDNALIPEVKLPSGYKVREVNMVANGLCEKCN